MSEFDGLFCFLSSPAKRVPYKLDQLLPFPFGLGEENVNKAVVNL